MKRHTERLPYPYRRGHKRLMLNHFILDIFMYSFILSSLQFFYLSRIENVWEFVVYNKKLYITILSCMIVSLTGSLTTKLIVGSQKRILTLRNITIVIISSILTGLLLYLDVITAIFDQYTFMITIIVVVGLKLLNILISRALGGFLW